MLNKPTIRWRLTILSGFLLTICCIGLTVVLNLSAFKLADKIDAAVITAPAIDTPFTPEQEILMQELAPSIPTEDMQNAKRWFSFQSLFYMLAIICGGSALTYYVSGKVLKPLDTLNSQVKNITVNNLSSSLIVPQTKDEIAELASSFNIMTDKLNEAFLIQKRFSASAAHELRTPLAVLQTKVDVFKKKNIHTKEDYETLISVLEKQISRLRGLVGNLLNMTNLDDDYEKSNIQLKDIFEDIILELSSVASNKNISLIFSGENCTMYGNVDLIYRAFYNLIENGIKYNIENGSVWINVDKNAKSQIEISIKDNGIGIPDEMKKHIFEPFYRVDKSRSRDLGGIGLGLSIVDIIIQKHNGNITVLNSENGGTCFKIIL